jgi:hypothetical protein
LRGGGGGGPYIFVKAVLYNMAEAAVWRPAAATLSCCPRHLLLLP